jgi:hypothetical protein
VLLALGALLFQANMQAGVGGLNNGVLNIRSGVDGE